MPVVLQLLLKCMSLLEACTLMSSYFVFIVMSPHMVDLEEKITSIKTSIGGDITVTRCQNTLRITKIGKRRTTQFLKNYFSNESRSGGGELVSVPTLLEDGKVALVSFKQSQGRLF